MTHRIETARPSDFLHIAALDRFAWLHTGEPFIADGEHVWRVWCQYAHGLGTALMRAALSEATAAVLLTGDPTNQAAVQLYRNFGFEVRKHVTGYYRAHEDRFLMAYSPSGTSPRGS